MFILPIGHERGTVLRWPWMTLSIIGACFLVYLFQWGSVRRLERQQVERYTAADEYYRGHPYLEPDPRLVSGDILYERGGEEVGRELHEIFGPNERPESPLETRRQQDELDRLTDLWVASMQSHPYQRWGLVPAQFSFFKLITALFVHAGFLHLLGNVFFLYLAGPPVEDVWGRPLFGLFYLAAGVFASLMFVAHYPDLRVPLVGASGAISGVMGAFLVRYWSVKIKFFYLLWFWFRVWTGTFRAPAWLMLPLWLLGQLFWASVADHLYPEGGAGVAYWAHVWGFVFGAGVAFGVKQFKLEERFLKEKIHASIGLMENTALERAYEARRQGALGEAREILEAELAQRPSSREAAIALWDVALQQKRPQEAAARMMRCIWEEMREGDEDNALRHWDEVQVYAPGTPADTKLQVRVAEALAGEGRAEEAADLVRQACSEADELPPPLLMRLARAASGVDRALAGSVAGRALAHPELPPDFRPELGEILEAAPRPAAGGGAPTAAAFAPPGAAAEEEEEGPRPAFQLIAAVPQRLAEDRIVMDLDGKGRVSLKYAKIFGLGAAQIEELGYQPYFVLDIFLDRLKADAEAVRVVRCLTSLFDPLDLEPGELDSARAFRTLVTRLRSATGVSLYPESPAAFRPQAFPTFESIRRYEQEIRASVDPRAGISEDGEALLPALPDLPELPPVG